MDHVQDLIRVTPASLVWTELLYTAQMLPDVHHLNLALVLRRELRLLESRRGLMVLHIQVTFQLKRICLRGHYQAQLVVLVIPWLSVEVYRLLKLVALRLAMACAIPFVLVLVWVVLHFSWVSCFVAAVLQLYDKSQIYYIDNN